MRLHCGAKREGRVCHFRRHLLEIGAEGGWKRFVFHSWPVGWQSPKTHGIRTGGLGHQAATSAGAGCQQQPEAPHHSYDGICIKRRLQDQIATQQQPKLHFIPLLIAF